MLRNMQIDILTIFTTGRSGSNVMLVKIDNKLGVLKTKIKNVSHIIQLHHQIPFAKPEIYWSTNSIIFMEYIPGISIKQYMKIACKNELDILVQYISSYFDYCLSNSTPKNYYKLMLDRIDKFDQYTIDIQKFDAVMPESIIHGDFTLDNLLYYNNKFYMIDLHATAFDSLYFDANKLCQDLIGGWFVRNESNPLIWQMSCDYIYRQLCIKYPNLFNNELYKFMLLRILPYCSKDRDRNFIITELEKLCK